MATGLLRHAPRRKAKAGRLGAVRPGLYCRGMIPGRPLAALLLALLLALPLAGGGVARVFGAETVTLCLAGKLTTIRIDASGTPRPVDDAQPDCPLVGVALPAPPAGPIRVRNVGFTTQQDMPSRLFVMAPARRDHHVRAPPGRSAQTRT